MEVLGPGVDPSKAGIYHWQIEGGGTYIGNTQASGDHGRNTDAMCSVFSIADALTIHMEIFGASTMRWQRR